MANYKEPRKSKYFKDASDNQPKSKYFRQEGEERKSKYFKSASGEDSKNSSSFSYQNSHIGKYHRDAGQNNLQNRTPRPERPAPGRKGKLPQEVMSLDEVRESKGDQSAIFTNEKADKNAVKHYVEAEMTPDDNRRASQIVRTALLIVGMLIVAIGMNLFSFRVPYMPQFLTVEFSAIPEFITSLAFGPVFGVVIALIKNVVHMITHQPSFISELQNFVIDTAYIFIGGFIYTKRMFSIKPSQKQYNTKRAYRSRRILLGGFVGSLTATVIAFFATRYISYPLLMRMFSDYGYTEKNMLYMYQASLDSINAVLPDVLSGVITSIDSLNKAIVVYNLPMTFIKFMLISIATAILYPPITDYLHYRVKSKKQKRRR